MTQHPVSPFARPQCATDWSLSRSIQRLQLPVAARLRPLRLEHQFGIEWEGKVGSHVVPTDTEVDVTITTGYNHRFGYIGSG